MKISILVFPGTNREKDMYDALSQITGHTPEYVWHKDKNLPETDLVVLPGGFSYGDYLRCGAMAAHSPIMKDVIEHADKGGRIFGVCNGFQMLVETGLLEGALLKNRDLKFICKHVHLGNEKYDKGLSVPVAHGEGNYFANDNVLSDLNENDLIAYRYTDQNGKISDDSNPNGSVDNIAGIYNASKTILGMMPHPENAALSHHKSSDGKVIIEDMLKELF